MVRCDVGTNGNMILIENLTGTGVGNNGSVNYLNLDGITFDTR